MFEWDITTITIVIAATAFLTSMLTAFIGAGGGTALLLVMLFCLPAGQVIPIHGCIQLASNTSRIALFWHYMQWQIILRFIALMPVGVYIGLQLYGMLSPSGIQITIAMGILATLFIKAPKRSIETRLPKPLYFIIGLFIGAGNVLVGTLAPLLGAILRLEPISKEERVASLGFFGFAGNVFKIAGFTFVGASFLEYWPLILAASIATIFGNMAGKRLLGKITQVTFDKAFKIMLAVMALMLIYEGLGGH